VGQDNVDTAPYNLLESDKSLNIEVRNYESMVLVSTSMSRDGEDNAFRTLFNYIGGENEGSTEISMTAPVIMDSDKTREKGTEISMTAPVFMNENADTPSMSFVMPKDFTLKSTPKPTNPNVRVSELKDYKVATIQFSGTLSESNVEENTKVLRDWIVNSKYTAKGEPVKAGYNGPLTLPWLRRNEILIEVE